ncbi:MAG: sugar transferase [Solirubrobacterales bacterium]|nr:sugar transferase [Solirubrobacterales bacterium]
MERADDRDPSGRLRLRASTGPGDEADEHERRPLGLSENRVPESLAARAAWARARELLPALAAALVGIFASGLGSGLLLGAVVGLVAAPLRRFPMPLHLMPATRVALALIPPVLGCGIFALADLLGPRSFSVGSIDALIAGAAAALTALSIEVAMPRALRDRPVRIATLAAPDFAIALERELAETKIGEAAVVGWIDAAGPDELREIVVEHRIDLIARVGGSFAPAAAAGPAGGVEVLVDLPVRTIGADQLYEALFGHVPLGAIDERWFLYLMHPEFNTTRPLTDRVLEILEAIPLALLLSPFMLLSALAVKLTSRGPVLYRQKRVGEGGREFDVLKFRTMRTDSEAQGAQWSAADDPRVTAVGRVLRRLHLDELPQLLNVIRGDMTFVGPRPERPEMVAELERTLPNYRRRHLIKPGVTGWAQVRCGYAGSTLGTAWKLSHDLYYLKRRSRLVNLMIVLETLRIAGLDSHRPLHVPASQFLFGRELGIDLSADAVGGLPPEVSSAA